MSKPNNQTGPNARPSERNEYIRRAQSGQSFSKGSPVAGVHGVAHPDGESQYHDRLGGGLKIRAEGTYVHHFAPDSAAQPLHERATQDVARKTYGGDQQGGNQHKAPIVGSKYARMRDARMRDTITPFSGICSHL